MQFPLIIEKGYLFGSFYFQAWFERMLTAFQSITTHWGRYHAILICYCVATIYWHMLHRLSARFTLKSDWCSSFKDLIAFACLINNSVCHNEGLFGTWRVYHRAETNRNEWAKCGQLLQQQLHVLLMKVDMSSFPLLPFQWRIPQSGPQWSTTQTSGRNPWGMAWPIIMLRRINHL